jgi:hypothetical protein
MAPSDIKIYGRPREAWPWRLVHYAFWGTPPAIAALLVSLGWLLLKGAYPRAQGCATAILVAVALWTLFWRARQEHDARIRAALRYIERFNDPAMVQIKVSAEIFWQEHLSTASGREALIRRMRMAVQEATPFAAGQQQKSGDPCQTGQADSAFWTGLFSMYTFLNFLEELALAFRRGYTERQVVRQFFQDVFAQVDSFYRPFILDYRAMRVGAYPHLLLLVEELAREDANRT